MLVVSTASVLMLLGVLSRVQISLVLFALSLIPGPWSHGVQFRRNATSSGRTFWFRLVGLGGLALGLARGLAGGVCGSLAFLSMIVFSSMPSGPGKRSGRSAATQDGVVAEIRGHFLKA